MIAAAKQEEQRLEREEFAYEKQQDRQARLMTEGMKAEQIAQEVAVKNRFGTGI
jgi:hypothetical protein